MTNSSVEIKQILDDFKEWLVSEQGNASLSSIEKEKKEVKELMKKLEPLDKQSNEFVDLILYGLLPNYENSFSKRVSMFPCFMNIKTFFEAYNYNYSEEDWIKIANMIYDLANNFQKDPEKIELWIKEFSSNGKYCRRLQSGSLSSILFAINDDYPLINPAVIETYNFFSDKFGWNDKMSNQLNDYLDSFEKSKKLIKSLNFNEFKDLGLFDIFCFWYVYLYSKSEINKEKPKIIVSKPIQITEKKDVNYLEILNSVNQFDLSKLQPHKVKTSNLIQINDIIQNCSEGKWKLPKFQRFFDWKKNDIQDFLSSIFNDYYVGSFLLWNSGEVPELETVPINDDFVDKGHRLESIILDGQQRITSLMYAIKGPNSKYSWSNEKPVYYYIDFENFFTNGDEEKVIEVLSNKLEEEESFKKMLFPLYELENYVNWIIGFSKYLENSTDSKSKEILLMHNIIHQKLNRFKSGFGIPYIELPETMNIDQVTTIFEKINTAGIKLSVFDLLIARLFRYGISFRDIWNITCSQNSKNDYFQKIDKMPIYILQAISLVYNSSNACKRKDVLDIYQNVFQSNKDNFSFDEKWNEMTSFVNDAIIRLENPRDGFGIQNKTEVPFTPIIPILTALLKATSERKDKTELFKKINQWYWGVVFSNSYSSAVDTKLTADYKDILKWFDDDNEVPRSLVKARRELQSLSLLEIKTKGNAIYKGVLSLITLKGSLDFETGLVMENAPNNKIHKDHLFPKSSDKNRPAINSVLNMTWLSQETNIKRSNKPPKIYLEEFIKKISGGEQEFLRTLESHFINKTAYQHMKNDNFDGFISERQKEIKKEIGNRMGIIASKTENSMITPKTPFKNEMVFRDKIKVCNEYIHWFDKYFSIKGLKLLRDEVDTNNVKEIKIIMSNDKVDDSFRDLFKDFRDEMKQDGVLCFINVIIDNKLKSSIHDRWIISNNKIFNVPSPDVMARGQFSEINETINKPPFEEWWNNSLDIINDWDKIQKSKLS